MVYCVDQRRSEHSTRVRYGVTVARMAWVVSLGHPEHVGPVDLELYIDGRAAHGSGWELSIDVVMDIVGDWAVLSEGRHNWDEVINGGGLQGGLHVLDT